MNLFYTVNDSFVPQLGAAICSVCENNRESPEITFYVGSFHITDVHQEQLARLAEIYGRSIRFVPIDNLKERLGFDFDSKGWNEVILARLLIDRLLPEEVERVLYLDGDTIVRGSLSALWETDLQGKVIGAVSEPTVNHGRKNGLVSVDQPYYNSGVLLIDLHRWREEKTGQRILDYYRQKGGNLFAPDQDAINGALAGEIYTLSPAYNYFNVFWHYSYRSLVRISSPTPYLPKEEVEKAKADPRIIHYLGEERPWRRGNRHRYRKDYRKYLGMTPWKDTPEETGWEAYFCFYDAFWILLRPFPMLQYRIIDALIPMIMNRRKAKRLKQG